MGVDEALDESGAGLAGVFVDFLGAVVGLEIVDGFLVGAAGLEQKAGGGEVGSHRPFKFELLADGGHSGPVVVDVGDTVAVEHFEIGGL